MQTIIINKSRKFGKEIFSNFREITLFVGDIFTRTLYMCTNEKFALPVLQVVRHAQFLLSQNFTVTVSALYKNAKYQKFGGTDHPLPPCF